MAEKATQPGAPLATPEETAARVEEQQAEWGTYVASQQILFNGVIAYNIGDPVPVSNAKRLGYIDQGLVEKIDSAAGRKVIADLHAAITQQPGEIVVAAPVSLSVPVADQK